MYKALKELENRPPPDYSYVVQPEFEIDKTAIEAKIMESFLADEVFVGAVGFHEHHKKTKAQINEKYWMRVELLDPKSIVDYRDKEKMNTLGKEVAELTIKSILNINQYNKIQVIFIEQLNPTLIMKHPIIFTLPELKITKLSKLK